MQLVREVSWLLCGPDLDGPVADGEELCRDVPLPERSDSFLWMNAVWRLKQATVFPLWLLRRHGLDLQLWEHDGKEHQQLKCVKTEKGLSTRTHHYLKSDFQHVKGADEGSGDHPCCWPSQGGLLWGGAWSLSLGVIAHHVSTGSGSLETLQGNGYAYMLCGEDFWLFYEMAQYN